MKRILLSFTIILISFCALYAQDIDENWTKANYSKNEIMVPMRDGVRLFTTIYAPKDNSVKHPILISRTPYGCRPYGTDYYTSLWKKHDAFLKKGYIIVFQDVRGKYMSEGIFENVRPIDPKKPQANKDITDVYDMVDWLIKHTPNNNGKVGFTGNSYLGYYTMTAALANHKAIKAVCPQAPVTDWFMGDDVHHNGALMLTDGFGFLSGFDVPRPKPVEKGPSHAPYFNTDSYTFFLRSGNVKTLSVMLADTIKFWKDMVQHPNYDEWWQLRCPLNAYRNIKPAVLVVGGLFDAEDLYGTLNTFKTVEKNNKSTGVKLLLGPWSHGGWATGKANYLGNIRFGNEDLGKKFRDMEFAFFNYYLLGEGNFPEEPTASVFITGSNKWASFAKWPPAQSSSTPYYLMPNGSLSKDAPMDADSYTEYVSDPANPVPFTASIGKNRPKEYMTEDQRFASRRTDVITFTSPILDEDLTVAGELSANLWASISTTDADFIVKLIDVFPDGFTYDKTKDGEGNGQDYYMPGYQMLVRGDVTRGRFRNSFENPSAFQPNVPELVNCRLQDICHTFLKGHRIMVQIQSTCFPLVDRNPQQFVNIYECSPEDYVKSTIKIFHQADKPSSISLPVFNGKN